MDEYTEGVFIVAVYIFVVVAFSLPFLVAYLFVEIHRTINRAKKILDYVTESEEEARKYHD